MAWLIEWDEEALKELKKLGHTAAKSVVSYLENRIATDEDPRRFGKALTGDKVGLWRYRVGDYRIICKIEDEIIVVLVVGVGHRRNIYNS